MTESYALRGETVKLTQHKQLIWFLWKCGNDDQFYHVSGVLLYMGLPHAMSDIVFVLQE